MAVFNMYIFNTVQQPFYLSLVKWKEKRDKTGQGGINEEGMIIIIWCCTTT